MLVDQWLERARAHRTTHADPRLHALFESATIEPDPVERSRWQSSHGEVIAYEVTVNVTAESIAVATSRHSVMDEVISVLSASVSKDAGCSLAAVRLCWKRVARSAHGYRELAARDLSMDDGDELARELREYFSAREEPAAWLASASIAYDGDELEVRGVPEKERATVQRALAPLAKRVRVTA